MAFFDHLFDSQLRQKCTVTLNSIFYRKLYMIKIYCFINNKFLPKLRLGMIVRIDLKKIKMIQSEKQPKQSKKNYS